MNNRVTHFEIPCDDPEKTILFFKTVFGWTFQQFGNETYWLAMTGDPQTPGINGAIMKKIHPEQPLVNSINVDDVDDAARKVEAAGGKIVKEKRAIPGAGWLAFFKDPDGNIHGLWHADRTAK